MENYPITISKNKNKKVHQFEVGEYAHHDDAKCKYRVFEDGVYVASFEPDAHNFLQICQNPGKIEEDILHLLAEQIEVHHPQGVNNTVKAPKL
ncbi:hypothetical protein [Mucilaginibacter paludis]|uniref:Uncharacterized protein n=1 Tax=Mucilaginibacter paludis DSM 18603 TaxID=714943 RepID=H1Y0U1_9SPHI|nr:hypothetical protein [Mucilaginibacter paludis]EHQ28831.1 hypothetical protein Mucpa_4746 [Mucilaginibacter paludis DSM 18603]